MKKLISLIVIMSFMFLGCATTGLNPDYAAYTATIQAQLLAAQKPLVDIKVDENGKISSIVMNQPPKYIPVEQVNPHPIYATIDNTLRTIAPIGMIWVGFDGAAKLVGAGAGTSTNINSGNDNSSNTGNLDQSYGITDTVTTTTDNSTQ